MNQQFKAEVGAPPTEESNSTQKAIREAKAKVCAEFEKVCQTDKSLKRMVKEMHNIFDKLEEDVAELTKP